MIELSNASLYFVAFLAAGVLLLRNNFKYRNIVFLVLNLAVYIAGIKGLSYLLVAFVWVCAPYWIMKLLHRHMLSKKLEAIPYKSVLIGLMVAIFAYLMKYDAIFVTLGIPYVFAFRLLGLSYFLFREIDFIMQYEFIVEDDIRLTFVDYLNYVLSFYTLLAGPIQRYCDFVEDFYSEVHPLTRDDIFKYLNRILNGYIKVYVISAVLSHYANSFFEGLKNHSSILTTAAAFVIFALLNGWFIYFNFSGYCDIVISFAALSGLKIKENFNRPYLASSVVEFWNRHHITLSEWIRDYIYSPVFKMFISGPFEKNVQMGQYVALFLTFTLAGVWHGTDANYLIYGLFQGLGVAVATAWKNKRKKLLGKEKNKAYEKNKYFIILGRCVTWMYICLTFSFVGYDLVGLLK